MKTSSDTVILRRTTVHKSELRTAVRSGTDKDKRDALFAPLESWSKFRRLHAYSVDHVQGCTPRDSEDARFSVVTLNGSGAFTHLLASGKPPPTMKPEHMKAMQHMQSLVPAALIIPRLHTAKCPKCGAVLERYSLMVKFPAEVDGELTHVSREYGL